MKPRYLSLLFAVALTGCSTLGEPTPGWWSLSEIPLGSRPHFYREWSAPRPVVPDTTIHRLVRSLLAQRQTNPRLSETPTRFRFKTTLFDTTPHVCPPIVKYKDYGRGYLACKGPALRGGLLRKLVGSKLLSPADTVFMKHQLLASTSFRLRPELLPGCQIISMDTLWAIRERMTDNRKSALKLLAARYGIDTIGRLTDVSYFSLPLFSRDLQTVIIDVNYGMLGRGLMEGSSSTYVLHRENRRWVLVKKLERWIT